MLKSFADGRLFGGTWGSGLPDVVALHGWRRTHQDFSRVFDDPEFTASRSAVALDLFGFGATPPPPEGWGAEDYARHLLPLFEAGEVADRTVVVGHSFGGRVAVKLARLAPERIDRLVLTGVPLLHRQGRRATPPLAFRLGRRLHRLGLVGDDRMEALRRRFGSDDYRAAQGVMRQVLVRVLAEQYGDDLAALTCPIDLVWGEHDTEAPVEVAERAAALAPSSTLRLVPGVGHLVPTQAPVALREVVLGLPRAADRPDAPCGSGVRVADPPVPEGRPIPGGPAAAERGRR